MHLVDSLAFRVSSEDLFLVCDCRIMTRYALDYPRAFHVYIKKKKKPEDLLYE